MLDKNRIRLMMKMAAYEKTKAKLDLNISNYYKKDYVSFNTLLTALWITLGYILIIGLVAICSLDYLMKDLTVTKIITVAAVVVGVYIVLLVIYSVCTANFYKARHNKAKQRIKRYYRDLSHLEKMMTKETDK